MLRSSLFRSARLVARPGMLRVPQMQRVRFQSVLQRPEIENRVLTVFKSYTNDSGKLTATATFQDLGLDSLDAVELMVAVEEEFGIEIPDKESDEIRSVKDAIDYIGAQPEAR